MSEDNRFAKVPPHDLDAERSVLAAVLIDPEAIIKATEVLTPESFYAKAHKLIFEAMIELFDHREPIDALTLTNQLKKQKHLSVVGGERPRLLSCLTFCRRPRMSVTTLKLSANTT